MFQLAAAAFAPRDWQSEVFAKLGYVPTPRQQLFHDADEYDVLYGGARGGGKSAAIVADDILDAIRYPGIKIGAFRRSYGELDESLIRQLADFDFARSLGGIWNAGKYELRFANGSMIRYGYAETLADASRKQGGQYQKLSIDELTLLAPGLAAYLREQIRSGRKEVPVLGIRSTSNPGGADHAAVKARYIDATDHGDHTYVDDQGYTVRFIAAKVDDNPHVDAGYRKNLEAIPDENRRRAMLDGDWDVFSGMFFPQFSRSRHIVPTYLEIPSSWQKFAGIDYGYAAPWAVIWAARDSDGRLWVYRERYATKIGEADQARLILEADEGESASRFADDQMWAKTGATGSPAELYAKAGCYIRPARKGERLAGWQRFHTYLADGPACLHHRDLGETTCPMLHILDGRAPNLVREISSAAYDMRQVEDLDTRGSDHALDATRYLMLHTHRGPSIDAFDPGPVTGDWFSSDDPAAQIQDLAAVLNGGADPDHDDNWQTALWGRER